MFNPENHPEQPKKPSDWDILGVVEGATPDEIKTAYRKAVKEVHPDAGGHDESFRQINEAYDRLKKQGEKTLSKNPTVERVARTYKETQKDWDRQQKQQKPDPNNPDQQEGLWE